MGERRPFLVLPFYVVLNHRPRETARLINITFARNILIGIIWVTAAASVGMLKARGLNPECYSRRQFDFLELFRAVWIFIA